MAERDLLDRLEKAEGPSHELDLLIRALLKQNEQPETAWLRYDYTASLDAAIALVERCLPGWACGLDIGPKTCIAFVDPHDYADRMFGARHTAEAPTAALALLIALFRARLSRGEQP